MLDLLENAELIKKVAAPHGDRRTGKGKPPQYVLGAKHPRMHAYRNKELIKAVEEKAQGISWTIMAGWKVVDSVEIGKSHGRLLE